MMFESSPSSLPDRLQHSSSSSQVRRWENRDLYHRQQEQFARIIMSASANGDSFVMASPSYKRPRVNSDFDDCDDPLSRRAIQVYNEATRFVTKPFIARLSMAAELDNHHREFQFDDDVVDEFGIQVYGSEYDRGADEAGESLDLLHSDNSSLCCTYKCRNLVRKSFFSVSSFLRRSKNLLSSRRRSLSQSAALFKFGRLDLNCNLSSGVLGFHPLPYLISFFECFLDGIVASWIHSLRRSLLYSAYFGLSPEPEVF
jgi:hypothetical protein